MHSLTDIRAKIDAIDDELANLIQKRMEIVSDVAASKIENGKPVTDPARERAVLSRVTAEVNPEYENAVRLLFSTMFGIAKAKQRMIVNAGLPLATKIRTAASVGNRFPNRAIVACPGVEGAYAQQATSLMFTLPTILYFNGFEKVFEAVEQGLCPYGILPIENSAAGSVTAIYDLMISHRFQIVRALRLKVSHVLLANRGTRFEDVREVVSHPHAINQCSNFFREHPSIKTIPGPNTAVAAKELSESPRSGAAVIASRECAELYGLDVIAENIANVSYNYTRFICISKNLEIYPDANKFSVMLTLPHRPGALNGIIAKFASIDVNLTKLESRPIPGTDFEFRFTFDFEASPSDPAVLCLLSELSQDPEIGHFTFLGAYAER